MSKTCEKCNFCLLNDFGYSNYTTEGTTVVCLKDKQDDFDRWYGEDSRLNFAETCPSYDEGEAFYMDVDQENTNELDTIRQDIAILIKDKLGLN